MKTRVEVPKPTLTDKASIVLFKIGERENLREKGRGSLYVKLPVYYLVRILPRDNPIAICMNTSRNFFVDAWMVVPRRKWWRLRVIKKVEFDTIEDVAAFLKLIKKRYGTKRSRFIFRRDDFRIKNEIRRN